MTEQAYRARIRIWIDAALSKRPLSFRQLVRALPGVHPDVVAFHIDDDEKLGRDDESEAGGYTEPQHAVRLPVPHPLDFDWRFVESSRQLLLARALELTAGADQVILLGAPTVFRAALESNFPRKIMLIDRNGYVGALGGIRDAIDVLVTDVTQDPPPNIVGQVVVTDPPWYEEYCRAFLWAAARMTKLGGTVLLSAPPIGTRPTIAEEWDRIVPFAEGIGLRLISTEPVLRYRMLPFERNALRAAGHVNVEQDWRPGVLATFAREAGGIHEPRPAMPPMQNDWMEGTITGVRLRIRKGPRMGRVDPRLISIVPGDVLDSVSRRDARRATVDVWTSGNRVFRCEATDVFGLIVDAVSAGVPAVGYVEQALGRAVTSEEHDHINDAVKRVIQIVDTECEEYVRHWEG